MDKQSEKSTNLKKSEGSDNRNSHPKEREKQEQDFECKCGKKYKSLTATYAHIKIKHPDQLNQYRQSIKNPKKNGQGPTIRLSHINCHEKEKDLMVLADTTVKEIYDSIKDTDRKLEKTTQFLLDEDEIDSFDELDYDQREISQLPKRARDKQIDELLIVAKEQKGIRQIDEIIKGANHFQVFKLHKFNLTMIRQITKIFNPNFASKIQLQLEIILARQITKDRKLINRLNTVELEIWEEHKRIGEILKKYFQDWNNLRLKVKKTSRKTK